jgi:two-component system alkaline phosphatase synthesis response regulator PhoP
MSQRILLVEDEPGLVLTVTDLLAAEGYEVEDAPDGLSGLEKAKKGGYDLILLDVMLPGKSGFDVCRDLRQSGIDTPILMLTAKSQVVDRVVGLKLGADDYLTKPFEPMELVARIEALLRRVKKDNRTPVLRFEYADIRIDFEKPEVVRRGAPVMLSAKELQLLRYLIDNRGKVISREELLSQVWEYQSSISTRTVDVHMAWLRQKLEENPQYPKYLTTVRGFGYRFAGQ